MSNTRRTQELLLRYKNVQLALQAAIMAQRFALPCSKIHRFANHTSPVASQGINLHPFKEALCKKTKFIKKVTPESVDFVMHSRPFFLTIFNFPNYRFRTRMENVAKNIPIADARWIGNRLGQLSPEQIRDCFRSAGFSPNEVEGYTRIVMLRIEALKKL